MFSLVTVICFWICNSAEPWSSALVICSCRSISWEGNWDSSLFLFCYFYK